MGSCPDEWFYWLVVVPVGRCPGGAVVLGIVVLVGNSWLYSYLAGSCPGT